MTGFDFPVNARLEVQKRPVRVEAWLWTGEEPTPEFLQWVHESDLPSDEIHVGKGVGYTPTMGTLDIPTLEGVMTASPGDVIIRGVNGEIYPCKREIFEKTYDPVDVERAGKLTSDAALARIAGIKVALASMTSAAQDYAARAEKAEETLSIQEGITLARVRDREKWRARAEKAEAERDSALIVKMAEAGARQVAVARAEKAEAERDAASEECQRHQVGESYQVGHEHGSAVAGKFKAERDALAARIASTFAVCTRGKLYGFAWEREWPDGVYAVDIESVRRALSGEETP